MDLNAYRNRIFSLVVAVLTGILLLFIDSTGVVDGLYGYSAIVINPLRISSRNLFIKIGNSSGAFLKITSLEKDNTDLRDQNKELIEKLAEYEALKIQNESLKDQLQIKEVYSNDIIAAKVISVDNSNGNTIEINAGKTSSVEKGDIVIYGKYAVGEVIEVKDRSAVVLLITSPSSNIPSFGSTNLARGIVSGGVGKIVEMREILPDENVDKNELILTTGVDSEFPANLIIGQVVEFGNETGRATKYAKIEVKIDFYKLTDVYLIKGQL